MKIISMKQLREKFNPIRKGLEKGEEYLLLYRSKPLATLVPYQNNDTTQIKKSRPTLKPTTISVKAPPQDKPPVQSIHPAQQTSSKPEPPVAQTQPPVASVPLVQPQPVVKPKTRSVLNKFGMKTMLSPK